jgi:hypothetical protein
MTDKQVVHTGKMNSHENHGKLDVDVRIEVLGGSRVVIYFTEEDGTTREVTAELDGDNNERITLMAHGPYDSNNAEETYNDEPSFVAKVGHDRAYAYNNYTGTGGRLGTEFVKISDEGIELTNHMEFPEPSVGPKL